MGESSDGRRNKEKETQGKKINKKCQRIKRKTLKNQKLSVKQKEDKREKK